MKIKLLIAITGLVHALSAQTFQKTAFNYRQDRYRYLLNSYPDSIPDYCRKLIHSQSPEYVVYGSAALGYYYVLSSSPEKGAYYLSRAEEALNRVHNPDNKLLIETVLLNFQGSCHKHLKNHILANRYYSKGLRLAQQTGDYTLVIRFVHNMADVRAALGQFEEAIRQTQHGAELLEKHKAAFSKPNYESYTFNTALTLGKYYTDWYNIVERNTLLDSAELYYQQALVRCIPSSYNYYQCMLNIGGIHLLRKDYQRAIELFTASEAYFAKNEFTTERKKCIYNLALTSYEDKNYPKALYWFQQSDGFYRQDSVDLMEYTNSNYFQSRIYYHLGDHTKALHHYEIYLLNYGKLLELQSDEKVLINEQLYQQKFQTQMDRLKQMYSAQRTRTPWFMILSSCFGAGIVLAGLGYYKKRSRNTSGRTELLRTDNNSGSNSISVAERIPESLEQELLHKMKQLVTACDFLSPDFTLHTAAKKIKTNTSYLSHVINKYYHQTFSEYTNSLRIHYVMQRMQTDPQYREYSTQAVAESVGYKNAVSFTKSFKRKTGMTPFQYSRIAASETLHPEISPKQ